MKENAKRTLLFLHKETLYPYFLASAELLRVATPELTQEGQRSLLTLLVNRKYIAVENLLDVRQYRLTTTGLQALKTALPALQRTDTDWSGRWTCLVFKEALKGDAQFRYLRSLLVKYQSVNLSRGVYLYPDHFPVPITTEIEKRYQSNVSLFEIGKWLSDDERQIAIENYQLSDLVKSYSGISSEIERLINAKMVGNKLNHQDKMQLSSLFSRLYEIMISDMGLLTHYFPQVKSGVRVLEDFQQLCLMALPQE
jgi:DNA-binding transcriptional regulator PaaX